MPGDTLRAYDLLLCEYVRSNIPRPIPATVPSAGSRRPRRSLPTKPDPYELWLPEALGPELLEWALDDREGGTKKSLTLRELDRLGDAMDGIEDEDFRHTHVDHGWVSWKFAHRQSASCVYEIKARLTDTDADKWQSASLQFETRLDGKGMKISDGIRTVREWIFELRWLLIWIDPGPDLLQPDVRIQQPTTPEPVAPVPTAAKELEAESTPGPTCPPPEIANYVARLRKLFIADPSSRLMHNCGSSGCGREPVEKKFAHFLG